MADAVLALQPGALCSADEVRALAACLPTEQEAKLLAEYARTQPTLAGLSDAERLCIDLMQARGPKEATLFQLVNLRLGAEKWPCVST